MHAVDNPEPRVTSFIAPVLTVEYVGYWTGAISKKRGPGVSGKGRTRSPEAKGPGKTLENPGACSIGATG